MAKQVIVYNMMDEAELKQKLTNKKINYRQVAHHFENSILDLLTTDKHPKMDTVNLILRNTKEQLAIVFVRSFLPAGEIRIGDEKGMRKSTVRGI